MRGIRADVVVKYVWIMCAYN